ncbi:MAG TPA: thioredoxin family protein [Gammaproteobacteria bacterium]|nr:thioredoxin family protein [Gammaproteobacteria bacterium]
MIRRALLTAAALGAALAAAVGALYATNGAPAVPSVSALEAANPTKPFVVKLHAQWCPICRITKGVWSDIAATYGDRVNLVVLDFTDETTTDASRAEAERLGLGSYFEDHSGWTGTISIVDGSTKEVTADIHGSRDFAEYRAAIDGALARAVR